MRVEEWPTTITFQPGALKNDPASSKRRPPTRRRLRDGECGPASQRLWKRHPHETMGLFDNIRLHRLARRDVVPVDAMVLLPFQHGFRGELGAVVTDHHHRLT